MLRTDTDQEEVARAIQRYDFLALPVVDLEKRLVGIVTVDDVIDVIEQEATRDIYAAGAVQAGDEDDYFQSNLFVVARRRIVWLAVLVLANGLTTQVIAMNDEVLKQVVLLSCFYSFINWCGGQCWSSKLNSCYSRFEYSTNSTTWIFKAIAKEALAGALLGVLMAFLLYLLLGGKDRDLWWQQL